MAWRKCLVRTLVFSIVGGLGAAAFLYQRWTSPAAIREQLEERLQELLPGANVTVNSASLSLLGYINACDIRLSRRDDPDRIDFAHFPSAKIYHDKEQLFEFRRLVIRQIVFKKPRLRVVRGRDGRLNIAQDLFSKPRPELAIPAVVIEDGIVSLEDYLVSPSRPAIDIREIQAVLVNDPLPQVKFQFKGRSDLLGELRISEGIWVRTSNALGVRIEAPGIPIKAPLIHSLAPYLPKLKEHAHGLEGTATVHADFGYQPASTHAWSHNVSCELRGGKLEHRLIPLPIDQLEAALSCVDGELQLKKLTARLGNSPVRLTGRARLEEAIETPSSRPAALEAMTPRPDSLIPEHTDFEGDLQIDRLPLTAELFAGLPSELQKLNHDYSPRGPVDLHLKFAREQGEWIRKCHVGAVDVSAAFHRFPYTLEHIKGIFDEDMDTRKKVNRLHVDLCGLAGTRPVDIKGDVDGKGKDSSVNIEISGLNIVLDDKLKNALRPPADPEQVGPHEEPKLYKLACDFHPTGRVDFQAFIRREANSHVFKNRYLLRFHDAALRYDVFPYPLEEVSGVLDVLPGNAWEARDFVGSHNGGSFRVRGRSDPVPGDPTRSRLWVEIKGENAVLDKDMDDALAARKQDPELARTWEIFHPRGKIDFTALVEQSDGQLPEVDVSALARGCSICPEFFRYALADLSGKFRYAKRQVIVEEVRARHGTTAFTLDSARAHIKAHSGVHVKMTHLRGSDIVLNQELMRALPSAVNRICTCLQLRQPFALTLAHFDVDTNGSKDGSPYIFWDGGVRLTGATFHSGVPVENVNGEANCRGQHSERQLAAMNGNLSFETASILKQPLRNVQAQFHIPRNTPDVVVFEGLLGHVHGGEVSGTAAVEFGPTTHFDLNLGASGIRLEEFGRTNLGADAPLSGLAFGKLVLSGRGPDIQNLSGHGRVDVPSGRLYNLPAFLGLLKVFDLRMPNNVFFDEAHARFAIQGPKVTVSQLDLSGNPFSLRGQGDMSLYGTDIRLDFYAIGARVLEYLPPVIKEFPRMLSENLWRIKVRGRIGDLQCIQEPVPIVVDPARNLFQNLSGRWGGRSQGSGVRSQESGVWDQPPSRLPDP